MNKKNIFASIILILSFISTSFLAWVTAKKITSPPRSSPSSPDFLMLNAHYIKFAKDGSISNQFYTSKITHFATNNNYFFSTPRFTIYNAQEIPWQISANKGRSEHGKAKVYLWDQVKIVQANGEQTLGYRITTDSLLVYPDTKFAETEAPLTISQKGTITHAVGAKADFNSGIITLLSQVKGKYRAK